MESIIAALSGTAQAITIAKAIRDADKAYDRATLRSEMAELLLKLTDARMALADAREALSERDEEIERLKGAFGERSALKEGEGGYKYKTLPDGSPIGFPMCPKCEALEGRFVQMKQDGKHYSAKCPACDTKFSPVTGYAAAQAGQGSESMDARVSHNMERLIANMPQNRSGWR